MIVAAFDVDGTLTPIKSSWSYIHRVLNTWIRAKSFRKLFLNGFTSYDEWIVQDLSLWRGLNVDVFDRILSTIPWRSGVEDLVKLVEKHRDRAIFIAVTGGFSKIGERCVKELKFYGYIGVELDQIDGKLTGFAKYYPSYEEKGVALKEFLVENQLKVDRIVCIGDDVNDIGLFKYCDISIAFCAPSILHKYATYSIRSCSLRLLVMFLDEILSNI